MRIVVVVVAVGRGIHGHCVMGEEALEICLLSSRTELSI